MKLQRHFVAGLLALLPLTVTVYVLVWVYNSSAGIITALMRVVGLTPPAWLLPLLPIVGILSMLALIVLVGALAGNYVGKMLLAGIDRSFKSIPLVREVYNAVQQIAHTLLGQPEVHFQRAALIEYPRKGVYTLCFITSAEVGRRLHPLPEGYTVVLVPTSPVPASGMAIIVPTAEVIPLEISIEEALKYVVSGGFILPEAKVRKLLEPTQPPGRLQEAES
jgi:uncharacterized membrane protein